MWTIIFLGPDREYLGFKKMNQFEQKEKYLQELDKLCEANSKGKLSIPERFEIITQLLVMESKVVDYEVI
jgi:hypothetical protein